MAEPRDPRIPEVRDPEDMDDEQRAILKAAAELEMQATLSLRDRTITEMASSLRWLQGSLLVVNGGGAVALLSSDALPAGAKVWSGAFFVLGIVFSLLTALLSVRVARDAPRKLAELAGYWVSVTFDFLRSEEIEKEFLNYSDRLTARVKWVYVSGSISFSAFVVACVIAGASLL